MNFVPLIKLNRKYNVIQIFKELYLYIHILVFYLTDALKILKGFVLATIGADWRRWIRVFMACI